MRKSLKKLVAVASVAVMAMSMVAGVSTTKTAKAAGAAFDPNGTYYAALGFQQSETWIFHDEVTSPTLGLEGTDTKEAGLDYKTDVMYSGDDGVAKLEGATCTGVELKGNGTYTVKVEGLGGKLTENANAKMTMVYISTNLPADAKDKITFSDVTWKMDGNTQSLPETQFFKPETLAGDATDGVGYTSLYLADTYAKGQGEYADSPEPLNPRDSMEITFTVSGFANDNPDAVAATEAPKEDPAASSSSSSSATDDASSSSLPIVPIAIAAVVVVVVVVVVVKKKNS